VVDDNADAAQMLAMYLEAIGHEVMVEHSAKQALDRAVNEKPDACILDIGLPGMDGNELARSIRSNSETPNIMLIAVTGYGQEQDRLETEASGFDQHLVKPVDTRKLAILLERFHLKI
jgi:CheY-like chemotaxis protein